MQYDLFTGSFDPNCELVIYRDTYYESNLELWTKFIGGRKIKEITKTENDYLESLLGIDSWEDYSKSEMEDMLSTCPDILAFLPVYAYIHGGTTISTSPFSCKWDSGQLGWAVIFKDDVQSEKLDWEGIIKEDVKYLDYILQGEVYSYAILNREGKHENSCGGFVGSDPETNGMLDHLPEELHRECTDIFNKGDFK